ncbi:hypothetical protein AB0K09_00475 [Streptomyces sp. NPDC049577]|uniref:hypothetical protein n=1 Tax=Streptomyces sp. NPDC049577 TaxID=3155153 RepID=UPI003432CCA5
MALPPLATTFDLAAFAQRSDIPAATAELALAIASATVRAYLRLDVTAVTGDVVTVPPSYRRELQLRQRPVTAVTSVVGADDGQPVTGWTLRGAALVREQPWTSEVTVTYDHGWAQVPDDIRGVVLALAQAAVTNPEMLRQVSIDDYSRTYATETLGAGGLSRADEKVLDRYRRSSFTVVPR